MSPAGTFADNKVLTSGYTRVKRAASLAVLGFFDALTLYAVYVLAVFLRKHVLVMFYAGFPDELPFEHIENVWWVFAIWGFFFLKNGLYTRWFPFWDEIAAVWKTVFYATVSVFVITSLAKLFDITSRTSIFLMGFSAAVFMPLVRINLKRALVSAGWMGRKVLILGAGHTGENTIKAIQREPLLGYQVAGFLDDDPDKQGKWLHGFPVLGPLEDAERWITAHDVKEVILSMPAIDRDRLARVINKLHRRVDRILFVPDLAGIAVLGTRLQHFFHEQSLAIEVRNSLQNRANRIIKRLFDLFAGSVLVLLLLPVLALIALLIKIESRGPVLFRQTRIGRGGRAFSIFKFRTMRIDSEERLKELLESDPEARTEWESFFKLRNDPRITRVGRFLRRTSLDELPQLFNVLAGQMSLVGPRPVTEEELQEYYRENRDMYELVRPGLTGLWQTSGRNSLPYTERVKLDIWYVKNWNLWLDVVMLLKTVGVVLKGDGAY